ncbi:MAG: S-layer homology domain-containing protein, partial [Oscillospiraceae bacterium]
MRKYKIIKGYGDGTFKPGQAITYGEASTILLKLLGYETVDIGPFWPRDFVLKAQQIGLCDDMQTLAANSVISRGNAAIMLRNLMLMNKKDGTKFISGGYNPGVEGSILCATWETDPRLSRGQVRIYSGDKESVVTSYNDINSSLVGLRGLPVYDKNNASRLIGFVADTGGVSTMKVKSATADKIVTDQGELSIPRGTKVVVNGMVTDYSTGWFDVRRDAQIMVYLDNRGQPSLISVRQGGLSAYSSVMIYGVDQIIFTSGSRIIKNGAAVQSTDLNKYDVVA